MKNFNSNTLKALRIDSLYLLIKPFSDIGKKTKRNFKVFRNGDESKAQDYFLHINNILKIINKFPETISYIGSTLSHFDDISGILKHDTKRIFEMHELFEIKKFIYFYRILIKQLKEKDLYNIIPFRSLDDLFFLLDIDKQNSPSFYISTQYSLKYKELKEKYTQLKYETDQEIQNLKTKITNDLNLSVIENTITISRMNQALINKLLDSKYFYIDKENFANVILKIRLTEDIFYKQNLLNQLDNDLELEARNIINEISQKINIQKDILAKAIEEVGTIDLLFAKAIFARNYHCCIPEIVQRTQTNDIMLNCIDSYDIFLKNELHKLSIEYQAISISISNPVTVITGSNMGGKTSILKSIGQIAFMAQLGIPVPAKQAELVLFDNVFFSGPITQEDRADLSSFGFEVFTLQNVINSKGFNLFLLDEFGRGTNPHEGQALAQSVMDYFSHQNKTILVTATHYTPSPTLQNFTHYQMKGLKQDFVKELNSENANNLNSVLKILHKYMDYQPIEVSKNNTVPKSALYIAKILGLDKDIINKAEAICKSKLH